MEVTFDQRRISKLVEEIDIYLSPKWLSILLSLFPLLIAMMTEFNYGCRN